MASMIFDGTGFFTRTGIHFARRRAARAFDITGRTMQAKSIAADRTAAESEVSMKPSATQPDANIRRSR
jgi:hypothetical protein